MGSQPGQQETREWWDPNQENLTKRIREWWDPNQENPTKRTTSKMRILSGAHYVYGLPYKSFGFAPMSFPLVHLILAQIAIVYLILCFWAFFLGNR